MLKAYKYCLLPTEEQKKILANWFGACRFVYNLALETKIAAWASQKKSLSAFDLIKQLTQLKNNECPWLKECPAQSLESSISNLDSAYTQFFRGAGFPKFKKRSNNQSIQFRQYCTVENSKVRLTKIGWIDFVQHRPLEKGQTRTITVTKTATNKYFVSILIKTEEAVPEKKEIIDSTSIGVDVGLKSFATLSDGQIFDNPKYLSQQLNRLRIEQRTLARRYKRGVKIVDQSKGYQKQKLVVARIHEKIKNQREDFLHKVSTAIVKQFDTICIEDLNVKGMMQNRKLSKAISDVGWYRFFEMIEYKTQWYGKNIKQIGRFEASSKICSSCGNIFKELTLSMREWTCEKCGVFHDRDVNAAINIKNFGSKARPLNVNAI